MARAEKSNNGKPPGPPLPGDSGLDPETRRQAAQAVQKLAAGIQPSVREHRALRRFQAEQEHKWREYIYTHVSKGDYGRMAGRSAKTLGSHARRYRLPIHGREVNLFEALGALHGLLVERWRELDPDSQGDSPAGLERFRLANAALKELELEERRQSLVDRGFMRTALEAIADTLRGAGDRLETEYGPDARGILDEALLAAQRTVAKYVGSGPTKPR